MFLYAELSTDFLERMERIRSCCTRKRLLNEPAYDKNSAIIYLKSLLIHPFNPFSESVDSFLLNLFPGIQNSTMLISVL